MADNEDIGTKLDRIASLLGSFSPGGITPGQSSSMGQFMAQAESALGGSAPVSLDQTIKKLQDLVKTIHDSGVPLSVLHKQVSQLVGDAEITRKVMGEFSLSLKELGKLTPKEFARDFKFNLEQAIKASVPNLGKMLFGGVDLAAYAAVGRAMVDAFNAMDKVASGINRSIASVAIQGGSIQASGLGGVFGRIGSDAFRAIGSAVRSTILDTRLLNISPEQSSALMTQAAKTLPSFMAGAAPSFAGAAANVATRYGLDPAETLSIMTSMFRRGATSVEAISKAFTSLENLTGPQGLGLSVQELFSGFNELWVSTRQYGATTESVIGTLDEFKTGLREGVINISEIGKYQACVKELRPEQIMALASLSIGVSGSTALFGTSSDTAERANEFLRKLQNNEIDPGVFAHVANAVIEQKAAATGLPSLLAKDLVRSKMLPQLGPGAGRQDYEKLLYSATGERFLGGLVPGKEPRGSGAALTAANAAQALGDAFAKERKEALAITDATITVAQKLTMYADVVSLTVASALQGDVSMALRAGAEGRRMQGEFARGGINAAGNLMPSGSTLREAGRELGPLGRTILMGPMTLEIKGVEALGSAVAAKVKEEVHKIFSGTRSHS